MPAITRSIAEPVSAWTPRALALLLLLLSVALAAACDSGGGGEACTPACSDDLCQTCVDGVCASRCDADQVCNAGACVSAVCEPACDATACQVCVNGACASACGPGQTCEAGVCTGGPDQCEPACDAAACQACVDGACATTCEAGQACQAGVCYTPSVCEPACDADACEICDAEQCVSLCQAGQTCNAGVCEDAEGLTVFDIQDETRPDHPAPDSEVTLAGVVVTAIDGRATDEGSFWVQDRVGGAYSGVKVFNRDNAIDVRMLSVGTVIDLTGTYKEFFDLTEIDLISFEVQPGQTRTPVVSVVDPVAVANGGADAEAYEGCLVRVEDVTVTNANPDGPDDDFGEFEVDGALRVDDDLFLLTPDPVGGDTFAAITGVLNWSFDNRKLLPRSAADFGQGGGACEPACDADACQVCEDGACVSACTGDQVCDAGTCVTPGTCEPACDASACQVCDGGTCRSRCVVGETCEDGVCVGDDVLRVRDIQDVTSAKHPAENAEVTLAEVIVTAVNDDNGDFWVQDPGGGAWSGILVYNADDADVSGLAPGTYVTLTGTYVEFYDLSEIRLASYETLEVGAGGPPTVTDVAPADVANGGAEAEAYEGVLVRVVDVTVTNANPDGPDDDFGEFEVGGALRVDDLLHRIEPDPVEGDTFTSLTGVLTYSFENRKLLPRAAADVATGAACEPACDADACQVCRDGACVSSCLPGQTCDAGVCAGAGDLTIYDIQDASRPGHPALDSEITVTDVVVTAIDANGNGEGNFWVQEAAGGPYSGVMVYNPGGDVDVSGLDVGDHVDVTGTYVEFNDLTEIRLTSVAILEVAPTPLAPAVVAPGDVATGGAQSEAYEGVLVAVEDVTVTDANPDGPDSDFGEFAVADALRVDDDLFFVEPDPQVGDAFASIAGVMTYSFGDAKLLPRSAADVVAGGGAVCEPACDADACLVCQGGTCVSRCTGDQTCNAGVCEGQGAALTIYDIQDTGAANHPAVDSEITVEDVVVTAIDANGNGSGNFWVQEPDGGPYSGVMVYNPGGDVDVSALSVGAHVTVTGTYVEFNDLTEIRLASWDFAGAGATILDPAYVAAADVATGGAQAEAYEGVLVAVQDVTVTDANPDGPDSDFGEFAVESSLRVDDDLYVIEPDPQVGDTFTTLAGVLTYSFGEHKLLPRAAGDVVAGGAVICEPACDADACQVCQGGTCVSTCTGDQVCVDGVCTIPGGDCTPACDAAACELCVDGVCEYQCAIDEVCEASECVWSGAYLVTVNDLQDVASTNNPGEGEAVIFEDVVISAIDLDETEGPHDFWVQEPEGGPWSGIFVYNPVYDLRGVAIGQPVALLGIYSEYQTVSEVEVVEAILYGEPTAPTPEVVAPDDVATDGDLAEAYEGVLVEVADVEVTNANPDGPDDDFGEFEVGGALRVDDLLFAVAPDPVVGDVFVSIAGVLHHTFGHFKLLPRDAADVVAGVPIPCEPACDADACLVCQGGACVSACVGDEVCDAGVCAVPAPDAITIYDVQDEAAADHPALNSVVVVDDVVVTAIDALAGSTGSFYVQEPDGGPWSGVYVYNPGGDVSVAGLTVGAHITLTGEYLEYNDLTELQVLSFEILDVPATPLAPAVVPVADIATGGAQAEAYEGVLVQVENVSVTSENPDAPDGDYGEWQVADLLRVDDGLYLHEPTLGDCFETLTGVLSYSFGDYKLHPRSAADLVAGAGCE